MVGGRIPGASCAPGFVSAWRRLSGGGGEAGFPKKRAGGKGFGMVFSGFEGSAIKSGLIE
jgi:hypothetical protein